MAIPLCTNVCMYKRINKNGATFLIKKETKSSVLYVMLFWILFVCLVFFSTIKGDHDYIIIYLLTLYSAMLMGFVAYSKLCVSAFSV